MNCFFFEGKVGCSHHVSFRLFAFILFNISVTKQNEMITKKYSNLGGETGTGNPRGTGGQSWHHSCDALISVPLPRGAGRVCQHHRAPQYCMSKCNLRPCCDTLCSGMWVTCGGILRWSRCACETVESKHVGNESLRGGGSGGK